MNIELTDLFCNDLPTDPIPQCGKILVSGATGYIGGLLLPELLARGYHVRAMVRGDIEAFRKKWPNVEVVQADALDRNSLVKALENVHTSYYLIHSLYLGNEYFQEKDIEAARNYRIVAEEKKTRQIIYLGGLGEFKSIHSPHLKNRIEVAEELRRGKTPVTFLRAAIIIGSGSASYEIIRHLVSKLPVIFIPDFAQNWCQPIAIRDVVKYLVGTLETPDMAGKSFDIGGQDILTYEDMLKIFALILNRKIIFLPVPFTSIDLFSYGASLINPLQVVITC